MGNLNVNEDHGDALFAVRASKSKFQNMGREEHSERDPLQIECKYFWDASEASQTAGGLEPWRRVSKFPG